MLSVSSVPPFLVSTAVSDTSPLTNSSRIPKRWRPEVSVRTFVIVTLVCVCLGLWSLRRFYRSRAEPDIYEAVLRHQFKRYANGNEDYFAVSINDDDPSDEFLLRFQGHSPIVRPGSTFQFLVVPGATSQLEDGHLFRAQILRWSFFSQEVHVYSSEYVTPMNASMGTFVLRRTSKGWRVTGTTGFPLTFY